MPFSGLAPSKLNRTFPNITNRTFLQCFIRAHGKVRHHIIHKLWGSDSFKPSQPPPSHPIGTQLQYTLNFNPFKCLYEI